MIEPTLAVLDPSVFKAYDIRGIYREHLSEEGFYLIGNALACLYPECRRFAVGYDGRHSSPGLAEALCAGLSSAGIEVVQVGQVPTPCLYFAAHRFCRGSGLMVTGSHNPKEYNGLKMTVAGKALAGPAIQRLREACVPECKKVAEAGAQKPVRVTDAYFEACLSRVQSGRKFRIAIDAGNGVAGPTAMTLFRRLGCQVVPLFCEIDGDFPNHHPDPGGEGTLQSLQECVREQRLDFGLAFDGDGDRLGLVDERGEVVRPDHLAMIFAASVLEQHPGATIVYDVKSSRHLETLIRELGGKPYLCRTGHSFVKTVLQETQALFAAEMSGHFFFNDYWFGFDDALYAGVRFQQILSCDGRSCSGLFATFPQSFVTPEMNIHFEREGEQHSFISRFIAENTFQDAQLCTVDGLRVEFREGWGLVRASNTTPSLVIRFEADSEAALAQIQSRFRAALHKVSATLCVPF